MKENLLSAIKAHDFTAIRNICFGLSEEERQELKSYFARKNFNFIFREVLEKEKRYHFSNKELAIISYTIMCVCNTLEEVRKIELFQNIEPYIKGNYYYFLSSLEDEVLLDFVQTPQGAYMIEGIQLMYKNNPLEMSFQILWSVYKAGYILLNEGVFIQRMYNLNSFKADEHLTKYLLKHPETVVLFPSVPAYIQDTIFSTEEWKKIYHTLNKKGYFTNKNAILHAFIESLLNPWKKTVLDMYCRWIEILEPSHQELLSNQHTLFALLSSDKTSVVNFVMKLIKEISSEKNFDSQAFADNFALCFVTQKIAKSQLIGIEILEKYYQKQAPINPDYREQLAVLFTVPDVKLQEKVASLLTSYFNQEGLPEVIAPYRDYLKGKAQNLLQSLPSPNSSENSENSQTACAARTSHSSHSSYTFHTPLSLGEVRESGVCESGERILFLLGDCLREPAAHTIDVFLEGLITIQDNFPADWAKSLSPYIKQLTKRIGKEIPTDMILLGVLRALIDKRPLALDPKCSYTWEELCKKRKKLSEKEFEAYTQDYYLGNAREVLPFLFRKGQMVIDFILLHCHLPLLSTPTHLPFYIEAEVLVDKLLQYEAQGVQPDIDDLIVACNRLLFREVSATVKEKARQLKGNYALAIQYYLGLTDEVQLTEELLPLWAQITRIKYPDREFPEFASTSAKDILGVVKPFLIDYGWQEDNGHKKFTFGHQTEWVGVSYTDLKNAFPYRYYNANGGCSPISTIFEYKLSLNPHYPDAMLCDYISTWVTGNEVREIRNMSVPLEVLLRYDIRVRHSGWLYIGTALLFEKRPSRDLAYEYICQAIARGEDLTYLKTYLAQALAWNFLPITRFIEFLDRLNPPAVKDFGIAVVKQYLSIVKEDELPKNHKKLANFLIS